MNTLSLYLEKLKTLLIALLQRLQKGSATPTMPQNSIPSVFTPTIPSSPIISPLITACAQGIQEAEGWPKSAGHPTNPGDLRFTKYTISLGADGARNGFATFPTYKIGFDACRTLVTDAALGALSAYQPHMTIREFVKVYAEPESQRAWDNYVNILCRHIGKVEQTLLKQLL